MKAQSAIRIFMLRALARMNGLPMPEALLFASVDVAIRPRPTDAQKREQLRFLESNGLVTGLPDAITEDTTWTLTDAGQHEAAKHH